MSEATTVPTADTMGPLDKLMTADMARLMADNQRVLDRANRRAEAFAKWEANKVLGESMPEQSEDMQISIDSPVVNHHYPPQQQPVQQQPQGSGIGKVLAGAALGASLLGVPGAGVAGYLLSQVNQQKAVQPAPVVSPTPSAGEGETVDLGLKKIEDLEL